MRFLSITRLGWLHFFDDSGNWLRVLGRIAARRHSRKALARLDDHMLRDIGLTRALAETEVEKPFWRD